MERIKYTNEIIQKFGLGEIKNAHEHDPTLRDMLVRLSGELGSTLTKGNIKSAVEFVVRNGYEKSVDDKHNLVIKYIKQRQAIDPSFVVNVDNIAQDLYVQVQLTAKEHLRKERNAEGLVSQFDSLNMAEIPDELYKKGFRIPPDADIGMGKNLIILAEFYRDNVMAIVSKGKDSEGKEISDTDIRICSQSGDEAIRNFETYQRLNNLLLLECTKTLGDDIMVYEKHIAEIGGYWGIEMDGVPSLDKLRVELHKKVKELDKNKKCQTEANIWDNSLKGIFKRVRDEHDIKKTHGNHTMEKKDLFYQGENFENDLDELVGMLRERAEAESVQDIFDLMKEQEDEVEVKEKDGKKTKKVTTINQSKNHIDEQIRGVQLQLNNDYISHSFNEKIHQRFNNVFNFKAELSDNAKNILKPRLGEVKTAACIVDGYSKGLQKNRVQHLIERHKENGISNILDAGQIRRNFNIDLPADEKEEGTAALYPPVSKPPYVSFKAIMKRTNEIALRQFSRFQAGVYVSGLGGALEGAEGMDAYKKERRYGTKIPERCKLAKEYLDANPGAKKMVLLKIGEMMNPPVTKEDLKKDPGLSAKLVRVLDQKLIADDGKNQGSHSIDDIEQIFVWLPGGENDNFVAWKKKQMKKQENEVMNKKEKNDIEGLAGRDIGEIMLGFAEKSKEYDDIVTEYKCLRDDYKKHLEKGENVKAALADKESRKRLIKIVSSYKDKIEKAKDKLTVAYFSDVSRQLKLEEQLNNYDDKDDKHIKSLNEAIKACKDRQEEMLDLKHSTYSTMGKGEPDQGGNMIYGVDAITRKMNRLLSGDTRFSSIKVDGIDQVSNQFIDNISSGGVKHLKAVLGNSPSMSIVKTSQVDDLNNRVGALYNDIKVSKEKQANLNINNFCRIVGHHVNTIKMGVNDIKQHGVSNDLEP